MIVAGTAIVSQKCHVFQYNVYDLIRRKRLVCQYVEKLRGSNCLGDQRLWKRFGLGTSIIDYRFLRYAVLNMIPISLFISLLKQRSNLGRRTKQNSFALYLLEAFYFANYSELQPCLIMRYVLSKKDLKIFH
jgi:hypothetical protein